MVRQPQSLTAKADELEAIKRRMAAEQERFDALRAELLPEAEKRGAVFTSCGSSFAFVFQEQERLDTKAARKSLGDLLAPFMRETRFPTLRYSPAPNGQG